MEANEMNSELQHALKAVQHMVSTARTKAYLSEDPNRIAELLDQVDYILNLVMERDVDYNRVRRILADLSERFTESSKSILTGELHGPSE